jgi:DNA-binding MarR family transcriptional regulator
MSQMHTDCYCTQLRRASSGLTKIYDEALRPQGLKLTQFSMLRGLQRLGQATLSDLANELALDRTTMSRGVRPLIDAGWISSTTGESDAREKRLELSDRGRKKLKDAVSSWSKAQVRFEAQMGQSDRAANKRLVDLLISLQFSD